MKKTKLCSFLCLVFVLLCGGLTLSAKPVKMNIIDVAGNLQLTQAAINAFKDANPSLVSEIETLKATTPELPAKLKAQVDAKNVITTLVLTGYDGIASCTELDLIEKIMPQYKSYFPDLEKNYLDGAKKAYDIGGGYGIPIVYCPGGPMFTYNPEFVRNSPKTPQELLAFAKANPGKFLYARPSNSGPGRIFLQGLPYVLGDKDPKNPKTWDKTWAYLKELGQYIDYYPTGTGITFKELGEGTRWIIASHIGWDMNQRILGTIPSDFQGGFFDNMTWLADAQYIIIPKGLSDDQKKASLALIQWILKPEMQAITYDSGYFYPGPAVKNVTIDMAQADSQKKVKAVMRDQYDKQIKDRPSTTQLDSKALVQAFDMWDKLIGSMTKK